MGGSLIIQYPAEAETVERRDQAQRALSRQTIFYQRPDIAVRRSSLLLKYQ